MSREAFQTKVIKICPNPGLIGLDPQWSESREQAPSSTINSTETFAGRINAFIINLITWYHDILYAAVTIVFAVLMTAWEELNYCKQYYHETKLNLGNPSLIQPDNSRKYLIKLLWCLLYRRLFLKCGIKVLWAQMWLKSNHYRAAGSNYFSTNTINWFASQTSFLWISLKECRVHFSAAWWGAP